VRVFNAVVASVVGWLTENLRAKLALQRQDVGDLSSCPHPYDYASLRWLRDTFHRLSYALPSSGLFGWVNILCMSAFLPLRI
jgi:hypothetical protein